MPEDRKDLGAERQARIEAFVRRFLTSSGAKLENDGGVVAARLPRELAATLGAGERLALAFQPCRAADGPGAGQIPEPEYVAPGHPLLDKMIELARGRGLAASLLVAPALDPGFVRYALSYRAFGAEQDGPEPGPGPARSLRRALKTARFVDARAQVRSSRLVHQTQVLFRFKVALISDEKRESIVTLLVDPLTEEVDRPLGLRTALDFPPRGGGEGGGLSPYALLRLYRRAEEHLRAKIAPLAQAFEAESAARGQRELERIEEYYRGLLEERLESMRSLFRRLSAAGVRAELARTWQSHERYREELERLRAEAREIEGAYKAEIEELRKEREQRIAEVKEKHAARVEMSLLQAAYVWAPRIEWTLRLEGQSRRDAAIVYDVLRRKLVDFACECCGRPFADGARLCSCGGLACGCCSAACPGCGKNRCERCAPDRCHVCGRPLCDRCDTACPLTESLPALALPRVCAACRQTACPTCAPLWALDALRPS